MPVRLGPRHLSLFRERSEKLDFNGKRFLHCGRNDKIGNRSGCPTNPSPAPALSSVTTPAPAECCLPVRKRHRKFPALVDRRSRDRPLRRCACQVSARARPLPPAFFLRAFVDPSFPPP